MCNHMNSKILVCLHGFTHNGKFFSKLANKLTASGWLVIAPTFPGRGEQYYEEDPKNYNYARYVEYLEEITRDIPKFSILGSSMGGLIAMMYLQRNAGRVNNLILNDIGNYIPQDAISKVGYFVNEEVNFSADIDLDNRLKEEFKESNLSDDEFSYLKEIFVKAGGDEGFALDYDPMLSSAFWRKGKQRRIADLDYRDIWDDIVQDDANKNMRAMIIRGEESQFLPRDIADSMMSDNINLTIEEVPLVGHLPLFFKESEIALIDNFLNEN